MAFLIVIIFPRGGHSVLEFPKTLSPQCSLHPLLMANTEEVPENRIPRSCKSFKKIIASDDGFRIVPDVGFNGFVYAQATLHSILLHHCTFLLDTVSEFIKLFIALILYLADQHVLL